MPEFTVYYEKLLSSWNQDSRRNGKIKLELEKRPTTQEEKRKLERKLEEDFINRFRKQRRNIVDIQYNITRVVSIK